jgi:hypothetical protein
MFEAALPDYQQSSRIPHPLIAASAVVQRLVTLYNRASGPPVLPMSWAQANRFQSGIDGTARSAAVCFSAMARLLDSTIRQSGQCHGLGYLQGPDQLERGGRTSSSPVANFHDATGHNRLVAETLTDFGYPTLPDESCRCNPAGDSRRYRLDRVAIVARLRRICRICSSSGVVAKIGVSDRRTP